MKFNQSIRLLHGFTPFPWDVSSVRVSAHAVVVVPREPRVAPVVKTSSSCCRSSNGLLYDLLHPSTRHLHFCTVGFFLLLMLHLQTKLKMNVAL
jgi:hypothetical protein